MKFKNIFLVLFVVIMASCQDDDGVDIASPQEVFDLEKVGIDTFINRVYYDESSKIFKEIDEGQTSIKDDPNLSEVFLTTNGVAYTAYVYQIFEGKNTAPDSNDIVNVDFQLFSFSFNEEGELSADTTNLNENQFFRNLGTEVNVFREALPLFKSGDVFESELAPRTYQDSGEGLLIIPSGIAPQINGDTVLIPIIIRFKLRSVTLVANTNL